MPTFDILLKIQIKCKVEILSKQLLVGYVKQEIKRIRVGLTQAPTRR